MLSAARIFLLFFLFWSVCVTAQNPADARRNGERAFDNGRWAIAEAQLALYQKAKPGDLDVLSKLGIALFQLSRGEESRRYLEYVAAKDPGRKDPELFYYLGRVRHGLGDWEKAIVAYKQYLRVSGDRHPLRAHVIDNIKRCVTGMQAIPHPQIALVENLGDRVNTAGDEFACIPSLNHADRIYFAAARQGSSGGERNDDGFEDTQRGHWCSDMYAARLLNSGWEMQGSLGGLLNTSRFEVPLGFNNNGQILYFFRGYTLYSGEIFADTAARKDEYSMQLPAFVSPVKTEYGDCNPLFYNDHTILFASRRQGGQGGLDLWWSIRTDSAWTEPQNMGPEVNSSYDEDMPFLSKDGATLYFSSNRLESMGGMDVFRSTYDSKKRSWTSPVSMGTPVNSPEDDVYFRLSTSGHAAFFASNRLGGNGQRDLYIAYYQENQPEQASLAESAIFTRADQNNIESQEIREVTIPSLAYTSDRDVLSTDNMKIVAQVAALTRNYPQATLLITTHTDAGAQPKFDLYNGIKRAEILGKAMVDRGIPANRVLLRCVGSGYPIAREVLDAQPNPAAPALNRRMEMSLVAIENLPLKQTIERPLVSEFMAAPGAQRLAEQTNGLSYRVEAATTRQILTNDVISMFGDLMIETQPGSGAYQYTAGIFKQYNEAANLRKDLVNQGFTEAKIIAYINGIRLPKAEAVALLKKYPDLAGYIRG
jgi:outer membrane protein OmpA-like peptidoglycan-associated protein